MIYWATHRQSTLVGCVQSGDGGMRIIDERSHQTYSLVSAGDTLKPGERVKIQGKKVKDSSGAGNFRVSKVVQELGACEGVASLGGQSSATRP